MLGQIYNPQGSNLYSVLPMACLIVYAQMWHEGWGSDETDQPEIMEVYFHAEMDTYVQCTRVTLDKTL